MRAAHVALVLSIVALLGVLGLALFGGAPPPTTTVPPVSLERPAPAVPAPAPEVDARLGGGNEALRLEVGRVARALEDLRAEVQALRAEQERLVGQVDPVADLLQLLQSERPNLERARRQAQATAAVATLRNAVSSQAQAQMSAKVDADQDGVGEYMGFREMSGAVPGRMTSILVPPVLSRSFQSLNEYGEAERNGYLYRIYLPDSRGLGIGEPPAGFDSSSGVDADLAETTWCLYAWPVEPGGEGRVFFMSQAGDVLSTEAAEYVGPGRGPAADAAFVRSGSITGAVAVGARGSDGHEWRQVN